jgi:exosortase E/protease (VPEID-CTERM system)
MRSGLASRLLVFGGLLLVEYLLISVLFDARTLLTASGGLSALGYLGDAAAVALLATAAVLGLMGPTLRTALAELPDADLGGTPWVGLAAHAIAYGAFLAVTGMLFQSTHAPSAFWFAAWVVAAFCLGGTWLPLAIPWRILRALAPRVSGALLIGIGAGVFAWGAGQASALIWQWFAPITLSVVATILQVMLPEVLVDEATSTIGTPTFAVEVAPICSGFEGIGLILAFLGGYMLLERKHLRFPRVLMLLPLGVITVWTANAVRIALLIAIGSEVSPQIALGGFHSKAGWLLFSAVALGFIAFARRSAYLARTVDPPIASDAEHPVAPYLMPQLVLLASMLVTGLVTTDFDHFYALRMLCAAVAIWSYRQRYRQLELHLHWDSIAIGGAVFGMWLLLAHGGDASATRSFESALARLGPTWAALWLATRTLGSSVVVPFAEELAFRGYLLRRLVSPHFHDVDARKFAPLAWLLSSLAFGALHHDVLAAALAGLAYAFAQQRRGRVTDAVIAHATTNLLLAADALFFDHWRWFA